MNQSLLDASEAVLRVKFIAIHYHLKKQKKISNKQSNITPKQLEKEEQTEPKVSRRKEITKIRAEITEMENKKK